ncbi:hypothetical protein GJW-30_1_01084 [Variibacter gotjawalensis]|uniref:Uncharacterized protein n=1 Tax=Variibacter gotjawalensis TaxID=1333996 RepID=A0A0S3PRW2_9BRAD|nr:hypothetical protein [Variibacter gotjawalensis]NIK48864.1 hypothetical protein [Variibacter gotjawalensis]RZS50722.1 hypothetical protein EV661_3191 [Variibacter gotjawalensis]BAT58558.1 hypothetical protein GJW-30_1_01084 [Variibacter gotjawalensis]
MPNVYRAYHIDASTSRITRPADILDADSDEEAVAKARLLVNGQDVEVWHGERRIAVLHHHKT